MNFSLINKKEINAWNLLSYFFDRNLAQANRYFLKFLSTDSKLGTQYYIKKTCQIKKERLKSR